MLLASAHLSRLNDGRRAISSRPARAWLAQSIAEDVLVGPPPCAATCKFAVNHYCGQAANTVLFCTGCNVMLVHVVDLNLVIRARHLLDHFNSLFAGGTTGAEDFNFSFLTHRTFHLRSAE